ncbi:acyl carrier protein [Pyxidicoccus xibeiensis]|uniref:acyl carrier protein n=1 Tax=Pyxidicoccus xibeiensis TaxID=2906759 RepID=UPI0020A6EE4D|nr:phosphopantetheine-binding protein [Pyxidicoccus xibeiensis]MCP3139478.1 acyl carrier protein [Pyxidicoccus xibeiensis]
MTEAELEVVAEIRRIAADELEWKGEVEARQDLIRDLQLDSLGLTVLAVGLENRFRIRLSEEDAQGVRTVEDLARLVAQRAATPAAAAAAEARP